MTMDSKYKKNIKKTGMGHLVRQAITFIGLSGIGWLLDFSAFVLLGLFSSNLVLNNIISSWCGVTFVFVFATKKIFQNNSHISLKWKYIIYLAYQAVLIYFISILLNEIHAFLLQEFTLALILTFAKPLSKILVTPVTMVCNFIVMKGILERL